MISNEIRTQLLEQNQQIDEVIKASENAIRLLSGIRQNNKKMLNDIEEPGPPQKLAKIEILRLFNECGFTTGELQQDEKLAEDIQNLAEEKLNRHQIRAVLNKVKARELETTISKPAAYLLASLKDAMKQDQSEEKADN